ncbi:MAG TPA: hypothetical protein V6D26_01570 [Stenomitos sp.]
MNISEGFFWGITGGALPEIYALYKLRQDFHSNKPGWINSWFYWVITLAMVLLGGGAVALYLLSGINVSPLLAIHIGIATPTLIQGLLAEKPQIEGA